MNGNGSGLKLKNKLKSIKRMVLNLHKKIRYRHNFKSKTVWLSLGENCLPDDLLRRHHRKSFSSVFSSGRSNIEYVLQMERDNYRNLLKKECLQHFPDGKKSVVRSTYYRQCAGQYSARHMLGFEFSHHDPLHIKEDFRAFNRRIARQIKFRGKRNFVFLYHHRITEFSDLELLRDNLNQLIAIYSTGNCTCQIILFYQYIIESDARKWIEFTAHDTGLLEFICHTRQRWGGDNLQTFWAKDDDDLFSEMFRMVDEYHADSSYPQRSRRAA